MRIELNILQIPDFKRADPTPKDKIPPLKHRREYNQKVESC